MRKMGLAVAGLYAIGLIGTCSALPIQSANTGDRNVVLLGALMFFSFGAVIAGCVCCRRRKKGFEEFRNESGASDANKTEYPIFRALSPEAQRHAAPIVLPAASNSNENLIEEEFDNNNGPISPADLENIENNNAVDYIRNQNEIDVTIEPSPYSTNRNLVNGATAGAELNSLSSLESLPSALPVDEVEDIHITVGSPFLDIEHYEQHLTSLEDAINESFHTFTNQSYEESSPKASSNTEGLQNFGLEPCAAYSNVECKGSVQDEILPCTIGNSVLEENPKCIEEGIIESTTSDDTQSIKSSSSSKSDELTSVEEALRALDCAIAEETSLQSGDDEDGSMDEDFECNNANFQNVLRQLLISDSVKRFLPGLNDDQLNDNVSKIGNLDGVRTEAELLVDSILNESRKIIQDKDKTFNDQTVVIQSCNVDDSSMPSANIDNFENIKSEPCTFSPVTLTPAGSVEDLLSLKHLDSSTPFVQKHTSHKLSRFPVELGETKLGALQIFDEDQLNNPIGDKRREEVLILNETFVATEHVVESSFAADRTFVFQKDELKTCDQTYDLDKTLDHVEVDELGREYIHPGDPCTSKQALERDNYPIIVLDHEEVNSGDMTTVTPVNTPIELNYSNEMWHALTKGAEMTESVGNESASASDESGFANSGWFLHPQGSNLQANETYDVDDEEEDEANLELTFEALRKQLAEVLPQPQGITGPPEYSDDEEDIPQNRTFDEYRSPLDATVVSLLEGDPTPGTTVQNEMFINYKRVLTPILEESEEETCKTFVMNETKCLDSTSTGCVDTGEAIMGVSKALMASNDTLFNFDDTLGEREEVFSPRTPSRSEMHMNLSGKSGKSTEENSTATLESEKLDSNNSERGVEGEEQHTQRRRSPPRTIDIPTSLEMMIDSDVCSPEQQKTFSEGTNSSNTDRVSSDISGTVDHDTTFTTFTNDEKTCVTVIIKDDERISEISEPEWGSTASFGGYEMNSLTDIPSLDYNAINDAKSMHNDDSSNSSDVTSKNSNLILNADLHMCSDTNPSSDDNQQDDSGNSTHMSADDRTTNSEHSIEDETQKCEDSLPRTVLLTGNETLMNQSESQSNPSKSKSVHDSNLDDREKCRSFLQSEIAMSSSQTQNYDKHTLKAMPFSDILPSDGEQDMEDDGDLDSSKENKNPNVKGLQQQFNIIANSIDFDKQIPSTISYQKVQTNSQDAVIVDRKAKFNAREHSYENMDLKNGTMQENIFYNPETTILPNKHHQTIINYNVSDMSVNGEHNEQHCLMVADEIIAHLSGEEDPWAEPLHNDIQFTRPCSEVITSFNNEWDSDVDDSHSSEEFMYVRGTPTKEKISEIIGGETERMNKSRNERDFFEYADLNETDVWSTHEDKIPVADSAEDEISEGSSSEFEGEFVPSCWDSMATPARSALKSPDKSSSQPSKKRRSVAFKKQRYHSVYEYPRETVSLSPSYSEPYLCRKNRGSLYYDHDSKEEFDDGFTVSSSMRPFHGSQFNALCHTWPTDSDFSWSQVEDLGDLSDKKKLTSYSNTISGKWPQNFDSIDLTDGDAQTDNLEYFSNNRPDSGVGESAEMLSDRLPLGELCHTRSKLRLPLDLLPPIEPLPDTRPEPTKLSESILIDRLILPTPSCTGSMDSISSSSGSERQVSFSTFGKNSHNPTLLNVEPNENRRTSSNTTTISSTDQLKPAIILIENGPIEFPLGSDKIKQSDSTDEDSGIESIMKVNKESD